MGCVTMAEMETTGAALDLPMRATEYCRSEWAEGHKLSYNEEIGLLCYQDFINLENLLALQSIKTGPATVLVMDSNGGTALSSIQMAELLWPDNFDIIVDGVCLSACANYLFPAAQKKYLTIEQGRQSEKSLIGYHGGVLVAEFAIKPNKEKEKEIRQNLYRKERAFYEKIGVSPDLPYKTPERYKEWMATAPGKPFWSYRKEEFAAFGVDNIFDLPLETDEDQ